MDSFGLYMVTCAVKKYVVTVHEDKCILMATGIIGYVCHVSEVMKHVLPFIRDRGGTVVKVLCYKSEGRWFYPRWCYWNFSLT